MKKTFLIILSILLLFVVTSCKDEVEFNFELNHSEYTLNVGDEVLLSPDKSDQTYEWDSSNVEVATVSNGRVTAIATGTTTISATALDVTRICQITVKDDLQPAPYFYLDVSTTKIFIGSQIQIRAYFVNGENDSDVSSVVNWSVDNDHTTIDKNGNLTGVSEGASIITATYLDESGTTHKDTCEINVTVFRSIQYLEDQIILANPKTVSGADNAKQTSYKPEVEAMEGTSDTLLDLSTIDIEYRTADEKIATVNSDGTIVAVGRGSTSITAKFKNKETSILVKVADTIATKADLDTLGFASKAGNDATLLDEDRYYILVDDIDYNGEEIVPIAVNHSWQDGYAEWARDTYDELNPDLISFCATIDGCGHAIKNAVLPSSVFVRDDLDVGIGSCFIGFNYGTLKNVAFCNLTTQLVSEAKSDIKEEYYDELSDTVINSGLIVENHGILQNVYLDIVVKWKNYAGAKSGCLTAYNVQGAVIENCIVVAKADYNLSKPYSTPTDCEDFGAVIGQSQNAPFTVKNSFAISSNMTKFITDNRYPSLSFDGLLYTDADSFIEEREYALTSMESPWGFDGNDLKFGDLVLNLSVENSICYIESVIELFSSQTLSGSSNSINVSSQPELVVLVNGVGVDISTLDIDYSSSNPDVAFVNDDGTITALSAGNVIISAKYLNQTAYLNVSVRGVIASKADLDVLGYASKNDPSLLGSDRYYVLTKDVDYNDAELVPIAANSTFIVDMARWGRNDYEDLNPDWVAFSATLDGRGYVIKNAYIPSTTMVSSEHQFTLGTALIGKNQGTIKNIGFVNLRTQLVANEVAKFNTTKPINSDVEFDAITDMVTFCGLINTNQGTLENIYLDMKIYKKNYGYYGSGALVANSEGGSIKNCIVIADKDYTVDGFKDYTGDASDITEFGVVIGVQRATNTIMSNVYAVSSTLTKFVSSNESSAVINGTIYNDVAALVNAKSDVIAKFGGSWTVSETELRFGNYMIWSLES